ncbi:hypothetical protein FOC1_g10000798 [Fusarium oxysporum f. sp. cubense race 1]|uniref:O-methyltransferase domain-containing protein n=1 Tax=Fusarium oxysporum f. sp. cubense (strain race 1) TaxID=1229664 RepID=N4U4L6_FUSC1|nr:hypothetical protein FOC1_g10000798 [Fusarium oxysporum f. sp. cubense race 1]
MSPNERLEKWVEAGGGEKCCAKLAKLTKTDPALIQRRIRKISGQHLVIETAEDTYKPTPWVHALAVDQALANVYGGLPLVANPVANPVAAREFSDVVESHSKYNLTPWPEVYLTGALVANYKPDRPLVVDVGGSKSHELAKFHIRHPNTLILKHIADAMEPGYSKLVIQESIINPVKTLARVTTSDIAMMA